MAYEKQTWHTGDVITQEKLNHMEDGIANALSGENVMIVHVSWSDEEQAPVTDKTYTEIVTAYNAGKSVVALYGEEILGMRYVNENNFAIFQSALYPMYSSSSWGLIQYELYIGEDSIEQGQMEFDVSGMTPHNGG